MKRDGVNLALFHGCETGTAAAAVPYAPFRAEQVEAAGLDHALLGHVHTPVDHGLFTYPGNPCPLHTRRDRAAREPCWSPSAPDGSVERTRYDVAGGRVHEVAVDVTGATRAAEVRERVEAAVADLTGVVRVTVHGALAPTVDLADLAGLGDHLDGLVLRQGRFDVGHDLEALARERTVRGQFVRDVRADPSLDEDTRTRVLLAGAARARRAHARTRRRIRRGAAVRIESVTAHAFGPLAGETLELAPGLTVVSGVNESAKSSWHAALYAALCGRGRGDAAPTPEDRRLLERYKPWDGVAVAGLRRGGAGRRAPPGDLPGPRRRVGRHRRRTRRPSARRPSIGNPQLEGPQLGGLSRRH